jgi:LuxR family transcriptional regulator, maltose regulon positive regulatory protein
MARATPRVEGATLVDRANSARVITVGTADWYAWLDGATTFAFSDASGGFTARKERRGSGNRYWKAYRKRGGVTRSAYLGKTADLTLERLQAAAANLAEPISAGSTAAVSGAAPATAGAAPVARATAALPTGTITFLFTDIEGSTQLWENQPQAMSTALARHDAILHDVMVAHGGSVFKTVGDSMHAVFVTGPAALAAALAAQRALQAEAWGVTSPLKVRMALHTGVAELRDGDYVGPPLNRAARLLAAGHGGQILLSLATEALVREQLPPGARLHDLGTHQLKDLRLPEPIFQLISPDLPSDFPPLRLSEAALPPPVANALPLLTTKLALPTARANLVPRPRLIARLVGGSAGALTLIAAPAGFGKTTLLTSWLRQNDERGRTNDERSEPPIHRSSFITQRFHVAWLALDVGDNDPTSFLRYVITALQQAVAAPIGALALALLEAPQLPPLPTLLTTLINDLAPVAKPVLLVLDDYHVIGTPALHEALTFLLERQPSTLHLVIASRDDPPLPLARLRAHGQVTELRAADLRFTPDEATAFLRDVMGFDLTTDEVAALDARTEGWIAGLQLAALAMRDRADRAGFIAAFTGSNRFVIDYLASEVLNWLPAHLRTFMLQTAILERMCGPLCDALLGFEASDSGLADANATQAGVPSRPLKPKASYSQLILEQIERANLFLIPLDEERRWYRYHHLFAEVLRERLASGVPAVEVAALHRRASAWYERHELVAEAIQHALTAADGQRAADLIERHGVRIIGDGQVQTVLSWLHALPETLFRTRPMLCILHGFALQFTNQLAAGEARVQDAERCIQPGTPPDQVRFIQGYAAAQRANTARYRGDIAGGVAFGQQVLRLLPETEVLTRTVAQLHTARVFRVSGDVTTANEQLAVAVVATLREARSRLGLLGALANLTRLQVLQGRLRAAAATYREMTQLAPGPDELQGLQGGPAYYVGMGELLREWNDLDAAERHLAQAMELLPETLAVDAEDVALGYLALARQQHARGDDTTARATLDTFMALARQRGFVEHLIARGAAVQAQIVLAQGNLPAAVDWANESGARWAPGAMDDLSFPREAEHLILARVWIAQARSGSADVFLSQALQLLERLLADATAKARMDSVLEILIVRALALWAQGTRTDALATITRALTLAAPEGYIRRFVDEGAPMAELLALRVERSAQNDPTRAYAERLLSTFPSQLRRETVAAADAPPVLGAALERSNALIEPLSAREREVLRLLATGQDNAQIARALVIAASTVKSHINHIFGKLGVRTRVEAVLRAQELNLL